MRERGDLRPGGASATTVAQPPSSPQVTRSLVLFGMREYAGTRRAGLNDEYARERCADQQQLQETPPGPHCLHLLDLVAPPTAALFSETSAVEHELRRSSGTGVPLAGSFPTRLGGGWEPC